MPSLANKLTTTKVDREAWFTQLYSDHVDRIRAHLLRLTRDPIAAQDLTQEVFLKVWKHYEQWSGEGEIMAWVYRIATHTAYDYQKSARQRRERPAPLGCEMEEDEWSLPRTLLEELSTCPDPRSERSDRLRTALGFIDRLPPFHREVVKLAYAEHREIQEVADILAIPPGTVKSRLHHARKQLNYLWKKEKSVWD